MINLNDEVVTLSENIYLKNILTNGNIYNYKVFKNEEEIGVLMIEKNDNGLEASSIYINPTEDKVEVINKLFEVCKDSVSLKIRFSSTKAISFFEERF